MHVGILSYDYDPPIGGLGVHVRRLENALKQKGGNMRYSVFSPAPHAEHAVSRVAARRWNKRAGAPLFSCMASLRLSSLIRRYGLDLIHLHAGSGGVFLLRKPPAPLVLTVHHTYRDEADVYAGVTRLRKLLMTYPERRTYALADAIMCVSHDTKEILKEAYGVPDEKLFVVENSVDPSFFSSGDALKREEGHLVFVGRIEPRKGVTVLLDALRLLRAQGRNVRVTLAGENLMGEALHAYIRKNTLEDAVTIAGHVDPARQRDLLARATVLVVPSIREGFGLVAAEGMAAGIPVVASDCRGLRSVIRDGETGMLFATGNAEACAFVLARLLDDPFLRRALADRASTEARTRFSEERQAEQTLAVYQAVASRA